MSGVPNPAFENGVEDNGSSSLRKRIGEERIDVTQDSQPEPINPVPTVQASKKWSKITEAMERNKAQIRILTIAALNSLVFIYFGFATAYYVRGEKTCVLDCGIQWCQGYGIFLVLIICVYTVLLYQKVGKPLFKKYVRTAPTTKYDRLKRYLKIGLAGFIVIAFAVFAVIDTSDQRDRLRSILGMVTLLAIAYALSKHHTQVKLRPVVSGILFQVVLGFFCIRWTVGRSIFSCFGDKVSTFLNFALVGSTFVFGELTAKNIFAFSALTVIFFLSLCVSILYYWGAMQWVIRKLGWILQAVIGTTVVESVNTAANIFLGMSESPLVVRPYIKDLTKSEIHAIMTSGYATVSGTVLAAYISYGADPAHLITASVMAAPGALAFTKLMYPETEESKTSSNNIQMEKSPDATVLEAATSGATTAMPLVLGIIANLIAFVSFVAFINGLLGYFGGLVGFDDISLEMIFGKIFTPLAWVLGVDWAECEYVGQLIGLKSIVNEFVAFEKLGEFKRLNLLSARSAAIATYAICGFANPSSLGIMIAALSAMCPEKKSVITQTAVSGLICGSLVCFMTASIAGLLMTDDQISSTSVVTLLSNKTFF